MTAWDRSTRACRTIPGAEHDEALPYTISSVPRLPAAKP
jgi:hypothetical protein